MIKTPRLLDEIQPSHYQITLSPDIANASFSGEEAVQFRLKNPSQTLRFHAVDVFIEKVTLEDQGESISGTITYDKEQEIVLITFPKELSSGEKTISFLFTGLLSDKLRGWYRSKVNRDGEVSYIAVTQFEETEARYVFPCIDEPAAKAVFTITLIVQKHHTALSNTIPEIVVEEGEKKRVQFMPTPKMSTYPLAFVVGEFECIEKKTASNVLIRVFVTPGKKKQGEFSLDVAIQALEAYETYFAIPYPLPVLDLIGVPDFDAGAMENWGAIVFRESALLIDSENSSLGNKQIVAIVVAHEIAHMWFGNLVTMEWWTHLWLNEGFACYMEYFIPEKLFPDWDLWTQFLVREHNSALKLDALKNTHPIEVEIENITALKEIFDEISYAKGASVIAMLATYLGEDVFRDGLRLYLKRHAYGNAATNHLWDALSEVSQKDVAVLMKNWTQKSGHPLIQVEKKKGVLHFSQQRFYSSEISREKTMDDTIWEIPLIVRTDEETDVSLMHEKNHVLPAKGKWQKVNSNETSFVRVLYSKEMYAALQTPIREKLITVGDRVGIIRDIFAGAEAGYSSLVAALELLTSYEHENDFAVWATIMSGIERLGELIAQDAVLEKKYDSFVCNILASIVTKVGWEKKTGEKPSTVFLRSMLLSSYGKHGNVQTIEKAKELFAAYITEKKPIDPDVRGVVYNLVARYGGEEEFEQLKRLYAHESLHQEKSRIGYALTAFQDEKILQKVFDWVISDAVRTQDTTVLILCLFDNPKAQKITWASVKKHWEMLYERFKGQHGLTRLVEGAGNLMTTEDADDIKQFFKNSPAPDLVRTVEQVLEQIHATVAWWKRDKEKVQRFFTD